MMRPKYAPCRVGFAGGWLDVPAVTKKWTLEGGLIAGGA